MPDYLGSILVFGIIITIFLSSWNSVLADQTEFGPEEEMRQQGMHTTTFLVSTPGYPGDWNSSTVQVPGFAEPDHVLQPEKLEEFRALSYTEQSRALQAQEFYLEIRNGTGTLELNDQPLEYGNNYTDASTVVPFTRTVQVNLSDRLETAELFYVVWR